RDEDQPFCGGLSEEERAELPPGRVSWRPSLTYHVPSMLRVRVDYGIPYRRVGAVTLHLDVYRAHDRAGPQPALLYLHGGGWTAGHRRQSRYMLYELAAAGWTVFAASYRFAPRHPLPAAIEDAKAALAWIRAHAAEHGARPDRVVVAGGSAGGH